MTVAERALRLGTEHIHTYWSNELAPRLTVRPGDTVVVETLDSSYGRVAREIAEVAEPGVDPDLLTLISAEAYPQRSTVDRQQHLTSGHPLTGPIAVAGARPGDTLVVEIVRIDTAAWGFTVCAADLGLGPYHHIWDLRAGTDAEFRPGIRIPLAPFCGIIGVAPAQPGQHSTIPPGRGGGNMDLRHLTAGATLYLPVLTDGALLSIGDVHAAQGDGEVCGTAIETAAVVTLHLDLIPGATLTQPRLLTSGQPLSIPGPCHVTVGNEPDLRAAARTAIRGTIDHLVTEYGLTRPEAYVLASVCVDLKISQLVDLPNYTVSAYLPLNIFR